MKPGLFYSKKAERVLATETQRHGERKKTTQATEVTESTEKTIILVKFGLVLRVMKFAVHIFMIIVSLTSDL